MVLQNVTINNLNVVLEASSTSLITLCTTPNINMWAKNKSCKHTTVGAITEAQRKSVNYGMIVPTCITPNSLMNYYRNDGNLDPLNGWKYDKPVAGTNYCRLKDFEGYNHSSVPPVRSWSCPNKTDNNNGSELTCTMVLAEPIDGSLKITDFVDWYFGVIIAKKDNTFMRYSATYKVTPNNINYVRLSTYNLPSGDYFVYPMLTNIAYEYNPSTPFPSASYLALPNVKRKSLTVSSQSSGLQVTLKGIRTTPNIATYTVGITLTTVHLYEVVLFCVFITWDGIRPLQVGEESITLGKVMAGETANYEGSFRSLTAGKTYKLVLRMGSGSYEYETFLLQPAE